MVVVVVLLLLVLPLYFPGRCNSANNRVITFQKIRAPPLYLYSFSVKTFVKVHRYKVCNNVFHDQNPLLIFPLACGLRLHYSRLNVIVNSLFMIKCIFFRLSIRGPGGRGYNRGYSRGPRPVLKSCIIY